MDGSMICQEVRYNSIWYDIVCCLCDDQVKRVSSHVSWPRHMLAKSVLGSVVSGNKVSDLLLTMVRIALCFRRPARWVRDFGRRYPMPSCLMLDSAVASRPEGGTGNSWSLEYFSGGAAGGSTRTVGVRMYSCELSAAWASRTCGPCELTLFTSCRRINSVQTTLESEDIMAKKVVQNDNDGITHSIIAE